MPQPLSEAMREVLDGWRGDLPPVWREVVRDVELDFDAIDPGLMIEPWEPIFPARRGKSFPGAPAGAHLLRAFDGIIPYDVRAVILGQDPYPEPASATGRAFEIGAARSWRELDRMFSPSVRAYTQALFSSRFGRSDLARSFRDWPRLLGEIEAGSIAVENHLEVSDRHEAQGVLLLNASLTLSRFRRDIDPHQSRGHLRLWRPLMLAVLRHLAASRSPVAFIGFGSAAHDLFDEISQLNLPPHVVVRCPHPAFADDFFSRPNPFDAANAHFASLGVPMIHW